MIVDIDFKPVELKDNSWGIIMILGDRKDNSVLSSQGEAMTFDTEEEAQTYIEEELY